MRSLVILSLALTLAEFPCSALRQLSPMRWAARLLLKRSPGLCRGGGEYSRRAIPSLP
jgi:hypothetical protein